MLRELNQVMEYIERHLCDDLTLEAVARYAGVSDYHFRTVFFHLSGMTLSEYIKKRRLSQANRDLMGGERVTEVAYKYGYQSLDGFARAFKRWSGYLPSDAAKIKGGKVFPKLTFIITVKGELSMECKIVEKPAFNLVGVTRRVPMQFKGVNPAIVELAMSITDAQRDELHSLQDMEPYHVVNASYQADAGFLKEEGSLTHLIGVLTTKEAVSRQLETVRVAAGTWAVFPNEGPFPATLQDTMARVYAEWLPAADYEIINAPTFSFTVMDADKADYAYSEVWTPVRGK